jgi:hypothetical protein
MGHTVTALDEIRAAIAASDTVLTEGRARLRLARDIASSFPGALRTYASGSIAQYTVNHPVSDGDGGLVLDRRFYPNLGPDGGGEAPQDVADELCALLGPKVRETYPKASCGKSKRGPKLRFGAPLESQDPTVDLVIALTRRDGDGLWIPNLERNTWEASHPEAHVQLLNAGSTALLRTRRRVIRLAKAWNKQYSAPGFSSFNLSMLALEAVTGRQDLATALTTFFTDSAKAVAAGNTKDPAGVSSSIKLLIPRDDAINRLRKAGAALEDALAHEDDESAVRAALARVFWDYVDDPSSKNLNSAVAAMRRRQPVTTATLGLAGPAAAVPATRAYGGPRL